MDASTPKTTSAIAKRVRPGGRTEKNRQAVAAAVLNLIQQGRLDFEIQEVAALSGVHRTTIFRRWPDRGALLAEGLAQHVSRVSIPLTGDWRENLRRIAYGMRDFLCDPVEMAMNRLLAQKGGAQFHEQMLAYWGSTIAEFERPFYDAKARGELSGDVDVEMVIDSMLAVIFYAINIRQTRLRDKDLDRLIDQTVRGCGPP